MFDLIRRKKKSIMGVIIAIFCVLLIIAFGLDSMNFRASPNAWALRINGDNVSFREYTEHLREIDTSLRQRFGENYDMFRKMVNLEQQALDSLINQHLLASLTERFGMTTSLSHVEHELRSLPYFAEGFSTAKWRQFLRETGMSERQLIEATRQQILQDQLRDLFAHTATPTQKELEAAYQHENRALSFLTATWRYSALEKEIPLEQEKLQAFYDSHHPFYLSPRAANYVVLELTPEQFEERVVFDEADLRQLYEQQEHEFYDPREIRAKVLHFRTKEKAPESPLSEMLNIDSADKKDELTEVAGAEAIRAKAKAARDAIRAGEDFDVVSEPLLKDPAAAARVEDLNWKQIDEIPEHFRRSAQNLEAGESAEAVETDDGIAIFYVEEVKERRAKSFDEVKGELEKRLRADDAPVYLAEYAENFYASLLEGQTTLKEAAEKEGRTVIVSESLIPASEPPLNLPSDIFQRIIKLSTGDKELIPQDDRYFIVEIVESRDEQLRPMEEVQRLVENDYRAEESKQMAQRRAAELIEVLQADMSSLTEVEARTEFFRKEAASRGATVEEKGPLARSEARDGLFSTPENIDAAFALQLDAPVAGRPFLSSGQAGVVMLSDVKFKSQDEYQANAAQHRTEERQAVSDRLLRAVISIERSAADIEISNELTNRLNQSDVALSQ